MWGGWRHLGCEVDINVQRRRATGSAMHAEAKARYELTCLGEEASLG